MIRDTRFLAGIVIGNNNFIELLIASSQTEAASGTGDDLASIFETNGAFTLVADGRTLTVEMGGDLTEPYRFQPSNTSDVSSFRTGVGSGDGVAGVLTLDSGIRPDAVAPTVTISGDTDVDEDDTLALSAAVSGGTYDDISYAWAVDSGGGTITGSGASVTYNPPDVSADTEVTVSCEVTATGDGTLAGDGTSATASDTHDFTVNLVLPDATAPSTFAITAVDAVDEGGTVTLTVTHSGGVYDTISYIWQILFSGGGSITGTGASVTYNAPSVSADTQVTVGVTGTARGTGTLAVDGTSQSATDQEVFTVRSITDTDSIWRLGDPETAPATPTGGESTETHTPTDWTRTQPSATETQAVWRSQRTRTYSGGSFVSATAWGAPTRVEERLLALTDAQIPDGRQIVGTASLIQVPADGDVFDSDATVLAGTDPPGLGDSSLNATRIYLTGRTQLRISEDGTGDIEALFSTGGAQEDYQVHVQTSFGADSRVSLGSDDIDATRSTAARLIIGTDQDPDGLLDDVSALAGGDRVLFFLSEPAPATDRDVSGSAETGSPEASASAEAVDINRDASGSAESGAPEAAASAGSVDINRDVSGSAETGSPEASASAAVEQTMVTNRDASGAAETGSPEASAAAGAVDINRDASGSAETGSPTAEASASSALADSGQSINLGRLRSASAPPGRAPSRSVHACWPERGRDSSGFWATARSSTP